MIARRLIVNADDFGLSDGVNRGIAAAHERGIVTSASLMVRAPAAAAAVAYARSHPSLGVGLHVDLGEWQHTGDEWRLVYDVVPLDDPRAVEQEVAAQIARFTELMGRAPTHLDSHQHVHQHEPVRSQVLAHAGALGVPVRQLSPEIRHEGGFYGQTGRGEPWPDGVTVETLCRLLRSLPEGTTELSCHPGVDDDSGSVYSRERALETATLCDPRVRATLDAEAIELLAYADLER